MAIICVDLNDTISAYPEEMKTLMESYRAAGHQVHVLSGWEAESAGQEALAEKMEQLKQLGVVGPCPSDEPGHFNRLVVVADPKDDVAEQKANYMRHVGSNTLVDNNRKNGKKARKAGFLALRPQGTKPK